KHKIHQKALLAQESRKSMYQVLIIGWHNITIGNGYNFTLWWDQFYKTWKSFKKTTVLLHFFTTSASALSMVMMMVPILGTIIWLFYINYTNTSVVIGLIATLPRQIQIIQNMQTISHSAMEWHGVHTKLQALYQAITPTHTKKDRPEDRISWKELSVIKNNLPGSYVSIDDLIEDIKKTAHGRMTIQGKNGAGKTSIMTILKAYFKDEAFYLPTYGQLVFHTGFRANNSTGHQTKIQLNELFLHLNTAKINARILLLDEWDAHLDSENMETISKQIDASAKNYLIIEIRHISKDVV
ncbi:MAG: hypothetical protein K2X94_05280, partial [Amoebophilaceae bacterium]|nr:hypothetical protein [Amoebophilaceae bacterium]